MEDHHPEEQFEHVRRLPLPWREAALTECGLPVAVHRSITREEFDAKLKRLGQKRTAMYVCMTCYETANRRYWGHLSPPLKALEREIEWAARHSRETERGARLDLEIKAVAILIDRHRAEFDELIADQLETVPLAKASAPRRPRQRSKW